MPRVLVMAMLSCALLMTAVAPVAQVGLPVASPESVGVSSARLERVKAFIQDHIDTNQIAGAVTLIARKGKVVHHEAQGWRHKEANQPMQKDTIFTLMSMTKPIVSTALMMLWEDGKFMLDDPIARWLPAYADKMVLEQFVRTRILEPLGMRDTHYNVPREKVDRTAAVYRPDDNGRIQLFRKPEFREPAFARGVAGLNGTAADYFTFAQMLLNRGEYNGKRLLGRMTVDLMFANHIGTDKRVYVRGDGYGFGLGGAVLTDVARAPDAMSVGTWTWGGAYGTIFWIDPVEELIPIMLIQISPYSHFSIRPLFSVVASQSIIEGTKKLRN